MTAPTRPAVRWHGGKWRLAPWVISHFPAHRNYVEPYCGAASVFFQKAPSYAETINDLDGAVINVFQVLRDPRLAPLLQRRIALTPFSREEYELSYLPTHDPVEAAARTIARSFMGFGSTSALRENRTGFRCRLSRSGTHPALDWSRWPEQVPRYTARLADVMIERCDALQLIRRLDEEVTLFYVDPPYLETTRGRWGYRHDMRTEPGHRALAEVLRAARGMVVLSGYPSALYDEELYPDWQRVERPHYADAAKPTTEVLWLNPAATEQLTRDRAQLHLLEESHAG